MSDADLAALYGFTTRTLNKTVHRNAERFPAICSRNDLPILPIDAAIAAASTELPDLHRDPFDRLLVATALERRLVLVTPDQTISQYPTLQTLW